jgi:hypothetical protein
MLGNAVIKKRHMEPSPDDARFSFRDGRFLQPKEGVFLCLFWSSTLNYRQAPDFLY